MPKAIAPLQEQSGANFSHQDSSPQNSAHLDQPSSASGAHSSLPAEYQLGLDANRPRLELPEAAPQRRPPRLAWREFSWLTAGFILAIHGLALLAVVYFSPAALGVAIFLHWLFGSLGICLGYHRLLTHRSFQVPRWLEYGFAVLGALALQGGPIFWVAGHRRHHLHTEDPLLDPYSAERGFWWSHMLWLFFASPQTFDSKQFSAFAPDLAKDKFYRWLDRNYLLLQVGLAVGLYALGGWGFVVYGIGVRSVLLWHSTWLINSATHLGGRAGRMVGGFRSFEVQDHSQNIWWVALLTYGEGWHNNHHAYPNVAQAGWKWWQLDMTWWVIRGLQRLGLAKRVVKIPAGLR